MTKPIKLLVVGDIKCQFHVYLSLKARYLYLTILASRAAMAAQIVVKYGPVSSGPLSCVYT